MYETHRPWAAPPAGQISAVAVTARYSWLATRPGTRPTR
jgi:hypothetical protein